MLTHEANRALTREFLSGVDCVPAGRQRFPLFALGRHSRNGKDRVRVEACNLPVVIGGVRVECDDILLGDEDGLVAIPRDHLAPVLAAAREIAAAKGRRPAGV